jgi:predicted Zn-ribbon and HTH transcriptional regulator
MARSREAWNTYIMTRYRWDPEFRRKFLQRTKRYLGRIFRRNRRTLVPEGCLLRCRYCGWTWKPKVRHVPSTCPHCHKILVRLPEVYLPSKAEGA